MTELHQPVPGGRGRRCCEAADGTRRGRGQGALVEPLVLAALARSAGHGYDLAREIEELSGGCVVPDAGGLYRVLRRLEEQGAVSSHWLDGGSGPQRRAYELTTEGEGLLAHWLEHLEQRRRTLDVMIEVVRAASAGNAGRKDRGKSPDASAQTGAQPEG